MKKTIIINDIKANKLLCFSTFIFMAITALMFSLTCFMITGVFGSVDALMEQALTPDLIQMHAGELNEDKILSFIGENPEVSEYQTINFLNVENNELILNGRSLADNTQDNGLCVQSRKFDLLPDTSGKIVFPNDGEIYVPVCYRSQYGLEAGQEAVVSGRKFVIAGFIRDSQMNSMMSSSKRFVVNENDYAALLPSGSEEYIIEFLLSDGTDENAFAKKYADAGLPDAGPQITRSIIRLINTLSDGLTALVLLLVSVVMLLISTICIRFTLLAEMEKDRREIGMLKAVGIAQKDIRSIYFLKFPILSGAGAIVGIIAAFFAKEPLQESMRELYGIAGNGAVSMIVSIIGAAAAEGILLSSIAKTLGKTAKMSAVEAVNGYGNDIKNASLTQYILIALVITAGVFLMTVPQNLYSTVSSENFVTYMGIGNGSIRADIRQTDDIYEKTYTANEIISSDPQTEKTSSLITKSYNVALANGEIVKLNIEQGDHSVFPVTCTRGDIPKNADDIAVSGLCAKEYGVTVGDSLKVEVDGVYRDFTVCGVYSDITNGGKTAKALYREDGAPVMWSVFYASIKDGESADEWIDRVDKALSSNGINAKIVSIRDFLAATYGPTIEQIKMAAAVAAAAALAVIATVLFLFTRLMIARERNDISLRKALGFSSDGIKRMYMVKYILTAFIGTVIGIIAGIFLGEGLVGLMLGTLGAESFNFVINAGIVYILIPLMTAVAVIAAVAAGLSEIGKVSAYECCIGRE